MARATRRLVLKRDGYRCTGCGATEQLQVHHIVPRRLDGSDDPANLTTLCEACHERLHEDQQAHSVKDSPDPGRPDNADG